MFEDKPSVDLYIDNRPSTPDEVEKLCESQSYMADYVTDDKGYLCQIRFDRVDL